MKTAKTLFALIVLAFITTLASAATPACAQKAPSSPADSASISSAGADFKIYYCRPSKRGREVFGKLVPYGEVWRTGANQATEFVVSKDISIAGKPLKAGRYALFTIPQKDKWTIILNSKLGQWGAYSYNAKDDVLRVEVPVVAVKDMVEMFTIKFEKADKGAALVMMWEQTSVTVPMTVN